MVEREFVTGVMCVVLMEEVPLIEGEEDQWQHQQEIRLVVCAVCVVRQ